MIMHQCLKMKIRKEVILDMAMPTMRFQSGMNQMEKTKVRAVTYNTKCYMLIEINK